MPRRRPRKNTKTQPATGEKDIDQDVVAIDKNEESLHDQEVESQIAAIRALRNVDIEQLQTMLRLVRSYFDNEQMKVPLLQFFKENLQNLSILETSSDGRYQVQWKEKDGTLSQNQADDHTLNAALLHRLSIAYPDYSTGLASMGGFEFSNKSVKTGFFSTKKLQIRSMVLEEPSDSQIPELNNGLQTPDMSNNNNRLSIGMTPKTLRLPKHGEMLLSVQGSPLGVYKEDNMETIVEAEDD